MKMDAGYDKMNIIFRIFCVYDEPSADLCLHKDLHGCKNLYLANVHHRAAKRDGVCSPGVRGHTKPWLITNVKKTGIEPVFHHNYSFFYFRKNQYPANAAAAMIRKIRITTSTTGKCLSSSSSSSNIF